MWDASPDSTRECTTYIYIVYYDNVRFGREFFLSARAIVSRRAAAEDSGRGPPRQSFIICILLLLLLLYYYYHYCV